MASASSRTAIRLAARATVAVCMASVAGGTAAAAAATAPRPILTSAEYRQLSASTAALNRAASSRSVDWARARVACRQVGRATALLRTEEAACLHTMNVLDALASFPAEQRRCSARTSTASAGVVRLMVCMSPRYQGLGRDARAMYRSELATRRQVLARGFTGTCRASLAPTAPELRIVRRFSFASAKLAADVVLLIRVTRGRAPSSAFNKARIDRDVRRFETSATAVLAARGPQTLSACPHR